MIKHMESRGLERDLVAAAYQANRENPKLRSVTQQVLGALPPPRPALNQLFSALLDAFPDRDELERVVSYGLGVSLAEISGGPDLSADVFRLMRWSQAHGRREELIQVVREARPDHPGIRAVAEGYAPPAAALDKADSQPERVLYQALGFQNPEAVLARQRSYLGSVCRVEPGDQLGTGTLIAPNLVLTCHHVVSGVKDPANVRLRFDLRTTAGDAPLKEEVVSLAADWLAVSSPELDYAVLRLAEPPAGRAAIRPAAHAWSPGEAVLILQHPKGVPLNQAWGSVAGPPDAGGRLRYTTNTEPGSSGAPVFNSRVELAGLHQRGGVGANNGLTAAALLADWQARGFALPAEG